MPLVIAMMAITLLTALGTVFVLGTMTETAIAANYRDGTEAFYAADAAVEFVVQDLAAVSDWKVILNGETMSAFIDGPPGGVRQVGAGTVDLTQATADINAIAGAGRGSPPYALYAYGRFADLVPNAGVRPFIYVAVWVADLSDEGSGEPGSAVVGIVGRAYGPAGSRRSVAVSIAREGGVDESAPGPVRVASWDDLR